jgi:hypothetical protein
MRLGIQLLTNVTSINNFGTASQIIINKGETFDLYFRLIDLSQGGTRYIPSASATTLVEIPQFEEAYPSLTNTRVVRDDSVRRAGTIPFADDRSIWLLSLLVDDTDTMTTSSLRVTLTDGAEIKIAVLPLALVLGPLEKGLIP